MPFSMPMIAGTEVMIRESHMVLFADDEKSSRLFDSLSVALHTRLGNLFD
jgi:hypothetical protein